MDIIISLPDELGRQLLARANREGLDIANFIVKVARRETNGEAPASVPDTVRVNWQEKSDKLRQVLAWIKAHHAGYAGQWVCLDGSQLISHGREAKSVGDAVLEIATPDMLAGCLPTLRAHATPKVWRKCVQQWHNDPTLAAFLPSARPWWKKLLRKG